MVAYILGGKLKPLKAPKKDKSDEDEVHTHPPRKPTSRPIKHSKRNKQKKQN